MSLPPETVRRTQGGSADPALRIDRVASVDSTNRRLLEAPFGALPQAPCVLWADEQTAGRGRRGRIWLAEPGRSLCFSVVIEARGLRADPSLSLAIGLALARSLAPVSDGLCLKWPNDLLRRGLKCGGILVERRRGGPPEQAIDRLVIGVGLNLLRPTDPEGQIGASAEGVFDRSEQIPDRAKLLEDLALALVAAEWRHRAEGFAPLVHEWRAFDAWIGRPVSVNDAGRLLAQGLHRGVGPDGALLLDCAGTLHRIIAGDVSLREDGLAGPVCRSDGPRPTGAS
jgi:BirA family biotin operon repressor/biotin-[acetyl-CoA-carboxylase] ligase